MSVYKEIEGLHVCERLDMTREEFQEIKDATPKAATDLIYAGFRLGYKRGMKASEADISNNIYDELNKIKRNADLLSILQDQLVGGTVNFTPEIISGALYEIALNIGDAVDAVREKTCS